MMMTLAEANFDLARIQLKRAAEGRCTTIAHADACLSQCRHAVRTVVHFADQDHAEFMYVAPTPIADWDEDGMRMG
jgi:hypothetical protein